MKYPLTQIMCDVRALLGHNPDNQPLIEVDDLRTLTFDEIIRQQMIPSVRMVLSKAPTERIDTCRPLRGAVGWKEQQGVGMAYMLLPDDFFRLLSVKMTDWHRPAQIITEDHPLYALQSSPFHGVRGNPDRPVAAVVRYPEGLVLELYSSSGGAGVTIQRALYVPQPHLTHDGYIDLPASLYDDILRQICENVMMNSK